MRQSGSGGMAMGVTVFHRSTVGDARRIAKAGFSDLAWDFGLYDARSGEEVSVTGVLLADRPLGREHGIDGDAVLEVKLDVTEDDLAGFDLEGMLLDARVWVAPAEWVAYHATVRIASVDPSTSGFFDRNSGEPEF